MFPLKHRRTPPLALALLASLAAAPARAQQAEDPIPPDVLLLLDTSLSMEDMIDDRRQAQLNSPDPTRAAALPTCTYGPSDLTARGTVPDAPNRWAASSSWAWRRATQVSAWL